MKISILLAVVTLIFFSPTVLKTGDAVKSYFIVWNVGQGQWASLVTPEECLHFDIGGEKISTRKIKQLCGAKSNKIYISHWDWDHISFANKARKILPQSCISQPPHGKSSPRKMKLLNAYRLCPESSAKVHSLYQSRNISDFAKGSNERSHVLLVHNQILIPGDSTAVQEKIWVQAANLHHTRWLLLGHHGSRTSTSEELLSHLPDLKMAVASARFKKYGHPHAEVIARLQKHAVPLLRTEDWGNVWFIHSFVE